MRKDRSTTTSVLFCCLLMRSNRSAGRLYVPAVLRYMGFPKIKGVTNRTNCFTWVKNSRVQFMFRSLEEERESL